MSPVSASSPVIINYMTPGLCYSELMKDMSGITPASIAFAVFKKLLARSTEVGARTLVHAVNPDIGVEVHGKYIQDCVVARQVILLGALESID